MLWPASRKASSTPWAGASSRLQEAEAEDAAVGCEGIVEVLDDDADVVDLGVG